MDRSPYRSRDWQQAFRYATESQRLELGFVRMAVALSIPAAVYLYSPWLALVVAIPCLAAFFWYLRRAVRRFLKREQ